MNSRFWFKLLQIDVEAVENAPGQRPPGVHHQMQQQALNL